MAGVQQELSIYQVELDRENPRIRRFLEPYEGELNDDHIGFALDVAGESAEEGKGATTPEKLRNSILANGGIMQPIIVNRQADGRLVCIEGNTRLYIYRKFNSDGVEGEWSNIPAIVHDNLPGDGIDAIRLQAHLVGPRPWDAYSKAKYQWELHYKHMMPLDRLVDLCGGDRRDVQKSINAYADMENHFRKLHESGEFYDTQRYSGFVELQNNKVKTAILKAGFSLDDFATWIKDGRIGGLASIRQLPRVLGDKKARAVFLKKGIKTALDSIEQPEVSADLRSASISQLGRALTEKIESIPFIELQRLRANPDDDAVRYITDALEALQSLIAEINQQKLMSGESLIHMRLVEALIAHVRERHSPPRGLLLLADHLAFGMNRPSSIGGCIPDLFASDLPVTFEVLGEAKTPPDLETPRSVRQITTFLDYLALRPGSSFYLSITPFAKARAQAVLDRLIRCEHRSVHIEVIDGV